jgi:hypothetical protein
MGCEFFFERLDNGPALLEFAQRCTMHPYDRISIVPEGLIDFVKYALATGHKFPRLCIKEAPYPESKADEKNGNVVKNFHGSTKIQTLSYLRIFLQL